jgi:hypothetical protein
MNVAGGPGDRWSGWRKLAGREESPDTVLEGQERATRLVTPGGRFGPHRLRPVRTGPFTESATEKIPPAERRPVISRRKTFGTSS